MQEALASKIQTEALLIGFELSKWASSHEDLCPDNHKSLFSNSRRIAER